MAVEADASACTDTGGSPIVVRVTLSEAAGAAAKTIAASSASKQLPGAALWM